VVEEGKKAGKKGGGALRDFSRRILLGVLCQVAAFVLGNVQDKVRGRGLWGWEQTEAQAHTRAAVAGSSGKRFRPLFIDTLCCLFSPLLSFPFLFFHHHHHHHHNNNNDNDRERKTLSAR